MCKTVRMRIQFSIGEISVVRANRWCIRLQVNLLRKRVVEAIMNNFRGGFVPLQYLLDVLWASPGQLSQSFAGVLQYVFQTVSEGGCNVLGMGIRNIVDPVFERKRNGIIRDLDINTN